MHVRDSALLTAERGAVCEYLSARLIVEVRMADEETVFREQPVDIHEQLELGRHFGPLHKHATTGVPIEPGLEEVHRAHRSNLLRASAIDLDYALV